MTVVWLIRTPRIEQLKEAGDVAGLLSALRHRKARVRAGAALALGTLADTRSFDGLAARLSDADGGVQYAAVLALCELRDSRAVGPLISALVHSQFPDVRHEAALTLGVLDDARAASSLVAALDDAHIHVCQAAAWALGYIGEATAVPALARLLNEDVISRRATWGQLVIVEALGTLHLRVVPGESSPRRGDSQRRVFADIGWVVARSLGRLGDRRAIHSLLRALKHDDVALRFWTAWALGELGDKRALRSLEVLRPSLLARSLISALDEAGCVDSDEACAASSWATSAGPECFLLVSESVNGDLDDDDVAEMAERSVLKIAAADQGA